MFIVTVVYIVIQIRRGERNDDSDDTEDNAINYYNTGNTNNERSETEQKIGELSSQDWIRLYNKTFDTNGNQITLRNEHIVTNSKESENDFDDIELGRRDNDGGGNDDQSSIYLSLDIMRGNSSRRSFLNLSSIVNSESGGDSSKIHGACVICLEEFEPGDQIVWASNDATSENQETNEENGNDSSQNRCKHVFHHECMVQYLASNSYRRFRKRTPLLRSAKEIENPCPTCRQNFCVIAEDDLAEAISNVSLNGNNTE